MNKVTKNQKFIEALIAVGESELSEVDIFFEICEGTFFERIGFTDDVIIRGDPQTPFVSADEVKPLSTEDLLSNTRNSTQKVNSTPKRRSTRSHNDRKKIITSKYNNQGFQRFGTFVKSAPSAYF